MKKCRIAGGNLFFCVATIVTLFCPGAASSPQPSGVQNVDFNAVTGRLGVNVTDADLGELLGKIAEKSSLTIDLGAGITKKVTVSFAGLPLEAGINAIVGAAGESNLIAEYTKRPGDGAGSYRLEKIVLLRKGQGIGAAGNAGGGVSARQERGALGELLRAYRDPKTTRDEKLKLRQSISRSARNPEEKALLKRAVLDPRNRGEIAEDLQMSLIQSMQEHPEGSDKAYVLELLRRESSPGPLVRAMVGSGDPTYVNYLMSAAQGQDLHTIELIGNLRITRAVPVLEQMAATPDHESPVRQAAEMALRRLGVPPGDRTGSEHALEEKLNR